MPEPVMQGMFSVYETAGGGYRITYREDGSAEQTHVDIPGMLVRMARALGAGRISISQEADGHPVGRTMSRPASRPPRTAIRREDSHAPPTSRERRTA